MFRSLFLSGKLAAQIICPFFCWIFGCCNWYVGGTFFTFRKLVCCLWFILTNLDLAQGFSFSVAFESISCGEHINLFVTASVSYIWLRHSPWRYFQTGLLFPSRTSMVPWFLTDSPEIVQGFCGFPFPCPAPHSLAVVPLPLAFCPALILAVGCPLTNHSGRNLILICPLVATFFSPSFLLLKKFFLNF